MSSNFDNDNVSVYDRLMRAWENSMELTRDFQMYAERIPEGEVSDMFREFAEDEAMHAARLRSFLEKEQRSNQIEADRDLMF